MDEPRREEGVCTFQKNFNYFDKKKNMSNHVVKLLYTKQT